MRVDLFTLFPEVCLPYLDTSIMQRAQTMGALTVHVHNIRDYTRDKHHITDDTPYGGGGGMILKPEPVFAAVEAHVPIDGNVPIILLTPQGAPFNQAAARALSAAPRLALLCGRYEGVDERVRDHLVTHEYSIGDFVLTGGELGALVIIDAVTRLLPGVLGDETATADDSFAASNAALGGLLEYPHYTRPDDFRGWTVPPVLQSGNQREIDRWRREQALRRTFARRPDLLQHANLSSEDWAFVHSLAAARDADSHKDAPHEQQSAPN